jgi:hypothetical protein
MPPDHDQVNGSVNLDDAGSVMREIVSPASLALCRIPGTGLDFAAAPHPAERVRGTP